MHLISWEMAQKRDSHELFSGGTFGQKSTVCILGALQRQVDLQGVFVKIGDFIKFKGFSCGIPREQAILRKSKTPRRSPEKWTFLSLAFYNAPSLHTVEKRVSQTGHFRPQKVWFIVVSSRPFNISEESAGNKAKRRLPMNPYGPEIQNELC